MSIFHKKAALIVIDMQKAFVEPGAAHCIAGAKATVPACAKVIAEARAAGSPVFWVRRQYRPDFGSGRISRINFKKGTEGIWIQRTN